MDVERTVEFLLDQQAKFWAGLEGLRNELRTGLDELRRGQEQLQSLMARILTIQEGFGNALVTLADAQRRTEERLDRLAEAQQHTDERINALIAVVNGLVRRPPGEPRG